MKRYFIILFVSFVISTIFVLTKSLSTSPLFNYVFLDSGIYQYIGFALVHGKIPYTEIFEHKGIMIYWINAIGYWIHPRYGIAFLQIINLSLVLTVWYKMLSGFNLPVLRFFILAISLLGICVYTEEGNLTEEWAFLFISIPMMLWLESRKRTTQEFNKWSMFVIGLCIGALFISRINNGASVIAMLLCCLIEALWLRKFDYIRRSMVWFSTGFVILPIVACCYMYILNGINGIDDMLYGTIGFNLDYVKNDSFVGFVLWKDPKSTGVALLPIIFLFPMLRKNNREAWFIFFFFVFTALSIGSKIYPHYFIVFVPLLVVSFAYISCSRIRFMAIPTITILYGLLTIHEIHINFSDVDGPSESFLQVTKSIPDSKRTEIWNMGGALLARDFMKAGIVQKNRILLPSQLSISKRLYEEENGKIRKVRPEYVIFATCTSDFFRNLLRYSMQNNYQESDADYQFVQSNYKLISSATCKNGTQLFCYQLIQ